MRAKTLILLFVALGCGMIAAVAVSKQLMDKGTGEPVEPMVEIFVAVKDLPHAEPISAENVKLEKWPKSRMPEGAIFSLDQIENRFTRQNIFAGEPILERKISESRESFSTTVPPGYRIFDIQCNASYIKPGDHVDILGTFRPGGRTAPPESRTVMRNVKVHGINGNTTRDSDEADAPKAMNKGTSFQLLVKDSQLEALTLANNLGELQLNLRPLGEDRETGEDTGRDFLEWINETEGDEEDTQEIFTQLTFAQPEPEEPEKHSMLIVTPTGVKKYEWTDKDDLPREVTAEPEKASNPGPAPGYGYGPSGNVYSGYGGYSPTYPTSVSPPTPPPGTGAAQDNVEQATEEQPKVD